MAQSFRVGTFQHMSGRYYATSHKEAGSQDNALHRDVRRIPPGGDESPDSANTAVFRPVYETSETFGKYEVS